MVEATKYYTEGEYLARNPEWHLGDSPSKVEDILTALRAIVNSQKCDTLNIADVGAGMGGVLNGTLKQLQSYYPKLSIKGTGFEISPHAVQEASKHFPDLDIRQKFFEPSDGPFDIVMLIDVLEHLENPREMLRIAHESAHFMVVRQPLIESFSTFRHNGYREQREKIGHIGYFNYRSFLDMTECENWKPFKIALLAPWELAFHKNQSVSPIHRLILRSNRELASYFMSGFYLVGAFVRT